MPDDPTDLQRAQRDYRDALAAADAAREVYIDAIESARDDGASLAEISAELGFSNKSTVSRLLSRAAAKC